MSRETRPAAARLARLWRRLQRPLVRPARRRQAGIALIVVTVSLAVLAAVVSDFAFNARVDLEGAANARDTLRAEYLARSGIQLARLLIKVQQSILDRNRQFLGDVQITDFAPFLMQAFAGSKEEQAGLGSLLGIDLAQMKGLGVGKNATFEVAMSSEDGRLNLNCGGGINPNRAQAQALYNVLAALFWPPRYDNPPWRIWGWVGPDGQVAQRSETARAIIDWTDLDEQQFMPIPVGPNAAPSSGSAGGEQYNYDVGRDAYRARNNYFDTLEELNLVRGVGDAFWGTFGELFTVYGGCQINVGAIPAERWLLMAAIIRYAAKDQNSPLLLDDTAVAGIAQQVLGIMQMTGGLLVRDIDTLIKYVNDPASAISSTLLGGSSSKSSTSSSTSGGSGTTGMLGIQLDPTRAKQVMTMGPRRIYRLDSIGTISRTTQKKIQVHIRGIWDSEHINQMTTSGDLNDKQGTWVYWRQD